MKGIESAFVATVEQVSLKISQKTGRKWLSMSVVVGEESEQQWVKVAAFFGHIEEIVSTPRGTKVYIEGKLKLHTWQDEQGYGRSGLAVSASLIQPLGLIGEKRPKKPRATRTTSHARERPSHSDHQRPIDFNDELPI